MTLKIECKLYTDDEDERDNDGNDDTMMTMRTRTTMTKKTCSKLERSKKQYIQILNCSL